MRAVYSVGVVLAGAPLPAGERARDGAAALQVVSGMERRGWRPNVVVLNSAMSACAKSGMWVGLFLVVVVVVVVVFTPFL